MSIACLVVKEFCILESRQLFSNSLNLKHCKLLNLYEKNKGIRIVIRVNHLRNTRTFRNPSFAYEFIFIQV